MRVLVVKLSSLGDIVHALPAVQDILVAHPGAAIDWVVEPSFAPLLQRVHGLRHLIPFALRRWRRAWWTAQVRREWRAFRQAVGSERYDLVIDLQGLTKSALVTRLAHGPSYGVGLRTKDSGWEWPSRWLVDHPVMMPLDIHVVDRSRHVVAAALRRPIPGPPRYGMTRLPEASPGTVVLVHGTSRVDKLWPDDRWIALGRLLRATGLHLSLPRSGVVEHERACRIAAAIGDGVEVWPEMDLATLTDRLGASHGVIGVDSGLSHMAVALDLRHVQIYNHPTAWRTGPLPAHGHAHQVSVQASPTPTLDAVWHAWQGVARRDR